MTTNKNDQRIDREIIVENRQKYNRCLEVEKFNEIKMELIEVLYKIIIDIIIK